MTDDEAPVPALAERARRCARRLAAAEEVLLASHIDADGLTSGATAATMLERAGVPFEATFHDQLDAEAVAAVAAREPEVALFTDFGSGQLDLIGEHTDAFEPVVIDHHQPVAAAETPFDARDGYADPEFHCNPLLAGVDGTSELSGAGATYLVARALAETGHGPADTASASADADDREPRAATDGGVRATLAGEPDPRNRDLAALAVVGAVGDMQASGGELVGANRAIAAEGEAAGVVETARDLALFGKQTRPLPKLLEYASDVHVPGISNDEHGAMRFLDGLDLEVKRDGDWRRWVDLAPAERRTLVSALLREAVDRGVPASEAEGLVATTYTLPREPARTELRDASEFSTLLNATARYERADVGLAVCLGDRDGALDRARRLLSTHRRNLSAGIDYVRETGVTREENVQWFHAGEEIRETIVGIVAGMAVGTDGIDRATPIVAFADAGEGEVKVSARGTPGLVRQGLDLSAVMSGAARTVGGDGGGHDVAAGATVPKGREEEFVAEADGIVGEQLS
ncbi:recombinase RecJ [Halobacteriales archaeon SW_7_71_33]|nr:MAG: recombinase RecJ [Halobacteriales archaeon SW_7_71_33]